MKKLLPCLTASFLLAAIVPAHATLIVYGVINGVVVDASGSVRTTVGMPVSGYFTYDYDLLSAPDSSGNRTVASVPSSIFVLFSSVGEGGSYGGSNLQLTVGPNGLPYLGSGQGQWDTAIGSSGVSEIRGMGNGWGADVTYTIPGVPDIGAAWFLLGIGLASVTGARRFFLPDSRLDGTQFL